MVNSKISEISNNTIIKVWDAVYFENIFPFKSRIPGDLSCTMISLLLVLLLQFTLNLKGAKELGLSHPLVKISLPIL